MEDYSTSSYPNSYISQNPKGLKNESHSLLHSVRKSQAKTGKRAPVAPPPPTPIRVFKVDPINFRDVVQQLTGAPQFKPHHQLVNQSVDIMPPINRDVNAATSSTNWYQSEALGTESQESGLLELNLSSPSSFNWCSLPI